MISIQCTGSILEDNLALTISLFKPFLSLHRVFDLSTCDISSEAEQHFLCIKWCQELHCTLLFLQLHVLYPLLICIVSAVTLCFLCSFFAFLTAASGALCHWIGCDEEKMWHVQILMTQQTANYPLAKWSLLLANSLWNSIIGNLGTAVLQHSRCCCV